jgi:hypothetical protein
MADIDDDFLRHYQRNKTTVPIESYGGCVNTMARIIAEHGTGKYVAIVHNLSTCTTKDSRDFSHPAHGVLAKFHRQHPDYIVVDVSSCGAHPSGECPNRSPFLRPVLYPPLLFPLEALHVD